MVDRIVLRSTATERLRALTSGREEQNWLPTLERVRDTLLAEAVVGDNPQAIYEHALRITHRVVPEWTPAAKERLADEVCRDIRGYGPIQKYLDDPSVTEVMVNGTEIWIERDGVILPTEDRFRDDDHVRLMVEKILNRTHRRLDESTPMVDTRLPDGSRINVVIPPIALDGPLVTIRKFRKDMTPEGWMATGAAPERCVGFLSASVAARQNVVISGGTGSGKTTLLNVLSSFIPAGERIVTIEDTAELTLRQPHVVRLETRPANMEGTGQITIRDLVRNALRMRPDRIVVGEVRAGEALDMLQAMNTGHDGSLTTAHANTPADLLSRLETMVLMGSNDLPHRAIREQIASALDLIVQQARLKDGRRRIVAVVAMDGLDASGNYILRDIWRWDAGGGCTWEPGVETAACTNREQLVAVMTPAEFLDTRAAKRLEERGLVEEVARWLG